MNFLALQTRVIERIDEDASTPVHWTLAEIKLALNKAQRLWSFITLCIERTKTFELTANQTFYTISSDSDFTDYLLPLRVTCSGLRVQSARIDELDALNTNWRTESGTPTRYAQLGFDLLAVNPRPGSSGTSLSITCACEPTTLSGDSDTPEIAEEDQIALPDYAQFYLAIKDGGLELKNALEYLDRFLTAAQARSEFVRARNRANQFDVAPFDLRSFDRSRMMKMALRERKAA
jgi:hypothetical protein